jgi:general stress protein CsbA
MNPSRVSRNRWIAVLLTAGLLGTTGCKHLGPETVAVDRFDYSTAIADSWKQQTLLNIVKLRYMDLPVFVDVASIVAGYSMQTGVSVNGTLSSETAIQGNFAAAGAQAIYTDRPTITYVPMTGEKFMRGLITPIDPKNIFFLLQAGYAADFILGISVESLNGVRNRSTAGGAVREADPAFIRVLTLLREVQTAGAFGMRVEEDKVKGSTGVVFFRRDDVSPGIAEKGAEIRRLLKLPAEPQKFTLTFSPARGAENELAVNSRSMMQIMQAIASHVDVPEPHLEDSSAWPSPESGSTLESREQSVRIYSGKTKPTTAFAAVRYRDWWFWVDNGDRQTKRVISTVILFFTLSEAGSSDKLPLVTIPAQ